ASSARSCSAPSSPGLAQRVGESARIWWWIRGSIECLRTGNSRLLPLGGFTASSIHPMASRRDRNEKLNAREPGGRLFAYRLLFPRSCLRHSCPGEVLEWCVLRSATSVLLVDPTIGSVSRGL